MSYSLPFSTNRGGQGVDGVSVVWLEVLIVVGLPFPESVKECVEIQGVSERSDLLLYLWVDVRPDIETGVGVPYTSSLRTPILDPPTPSFVTLLPIKTSLGVFTLGSWKSDEEGL